MLEAHPGQVCPLMTLSRSDQMDPQLPQLYRDKGLMRHKNVGGSWWKGKGEAVRRLQGVRRT